MKSKHQSISETPLIADLSLLVASTIANQRLSSSVTACDDGVASPVEYAFACAFFPCGDGIRIPKESAENVGLILRSWKRHTQTLSRQFSKALKSLPLRIAKSSPESVRGRRAPKSATIGRARRFERARAAGEPDEVLKAHKKSRGAQPSKAASQPKARITRTKSAGNLEQHSR
jgi:hypothetical protein